jgi:glycosyltransferase involved in cell wall biosynthesis
VEDKISKKMIKKNIFCPIITSKDIGGGIKSTISLLNGLAALQYNVTVLLPKDCEFVSKFEITINVLYFNQSPSITLSNPLQFYRLCNFTKNIFLELNKKQKTIYFCSDRPALMLAFLVSKSELIFYISRGWFYTNLSARFLRLFMFPKVNQFVGISDKQYNLMKSYAPKKAAVHLIQNGIDIPNHTFKPFQKDDIKLATIGGICDRKNQMQCLELIVLLKDKINVHLNIFGTTFTPIDIAYKKTLEQFIAENKLENFVTFKGNETNFDTIYSQSDIVLSTAKEEGFGRTIIEAMSYGIPVIANDKAGGPSTIITHLENGLLYDSSLLDLEQKSLFYLENKEEITQIIENALLLVKQNYTMDRVAKEYANLIDAIE